MQTMKRHATRAEQWTVYADNLVNEAHYMGAQLSDARRLMLAAWEGWISGEPDDQDVAYELLATMWAMASQVGEDTAKALLEEITILLKGVGSE